MGFLEELASRRRFGMKPGLETIRAACAALGSPQTRLRRVVHIAGTNGKGATAAILDAALGACGYRVARYTSPHLAKLNERFFLCGAPVDDATLASAAAKVEDVCRRCEACADMTFFEALTAAAFIVFAQAEPDFTILETGLGGRLDATNVCTPSLAVITRIGLDHCDWLGATTREIAAEKAGIIKHGVPVVAGANESAVLEVLEEKARALSAPFIYAPQCAGEARIPRDFSLRGAFNRENAVTALAALETLSSRVCAFDLQTALGGFANVVWPGRFQRVGRFIVDGAHNPPAARALAGALAADGVARGSLDLVCGFCADKDIDATLAILAPFARRAFAVKTTNARSMPPAELAARLAAAGIPAAPCESLEDALERTRGDALVCGSLFLAGDALRALGAFPWESARLDPSETLRAPAEPRA